MPRNLIVYGLAAVAGLVGYGLLRSVLGGEIVTIIGLIGVAIIGVIMVRNLQANRKVAQATPEQRAAALAFAPVAGKAALYVFRNQFVGKAAGLNVLIDGREVAQIKSPCFTRILLSPGAHRIAGYIGANKRPAGGEGLALTANAGDVLVLKCEVEPQMIGVIVKYTPLSLDTARADIQKIARMVAPDIAEL
jgi:hypothetical protein